MPASKRVAMNFGKVQMIAQRRMRSGKKTIVTLISVGQDCLVFLRFGFPPQRRSVIETSRSLKELFHEARERASKALGFAKMLRKVRDCTGI